VDLSSNLYPLKTKYRFPGQKGKRKVPPGKVLLMRTIASPEEAEKKRE